MLPESVLRFCRSLASDLGPVFRFDTQFPQHVDVPEIRRDVFGRAVGFGNASGGTILYGIAEEEIERIPAAASLSPVDAQGVGGD